MMKIIGGWVLKVLQKILAAIFRILFFLIGWLLKIVSKVIDKIGEEFIHFSER
jgi:hypothetical protein